MRKSGFWIASIVCIVLIWTLAIAPLTQTEATEASAATRSEAGDSREDTDRKPRTVHVRPLASAIRFDHAVPEGMELVADNGALSLYIHPHTTEIAVQDRRTGYVWHSNPPSRSEDAKASPLYQGIMSSQFKLTYLNDKGQTSMFTSYDDSVAKGQFAIEKAEDGVNVTYTLGTVVKGIDVIPLAISEKRFQEHILDKIEDEAVQRSIRYKFDFDNEKKVYTQRKMQNFVIEEVAAILESIGYTAEEASKDNREHGMESISQSRAVQFVVTLEYRLAGDRLIISVPAHKLEAPANFPIRSIQLMEFFGAAGTDEEGYMFVPDGSGALIRLNSGKTYADPYEAQVYGADEAVIVKEKVQTNTPIRLPVFGIVKGEAAMMGIIEEGDALSVITSDISGRNHSFNTVSARFDLMNMDHITLSSGEQSSSIPVYQAKMYAGRLTVAYAFLYGEEASYSGMAGLYREQLAHDYGWTRLSEQHALPFVLQVEGAFPQRKQFLGVPYSSSTALTTYEGALHLALALKHAGVDNLHLRLAGWFNKGIRHTSPKQIKLEPVLGGKKAFETLIGELVKEDIPLYPDVAFLRKYKGSAGSSYFLNKKRAKVYEYSPVYYMEDKSKFSHYVLSPSELNEAVAAFVRAYGKWDVGGLSLRDLGDVLSSDYDEKAFVDREQAKRLVADEAYALAGHIERLMISGGNAYVMPYAKMIVNAPMSSSKLNILDEEVPFYQIVLHGYVDYAGRPWNFADDQDVDRQLLKALETGAGVYFDWFEADPSIIKNTDYDDLYSAYYRDWFDDAVRVYREANAVLGSVRGQMILNHEKLTEDVYRTTYENGRQVIVNYGDDAVTIGGIRVEAGSYWAGGE